MPLTAVEGQPRAVDALTRSLESRTVHHAWLFQGPEGVGKELAAVALAQALTCAEKPFEGCGVCSTCSRVGKRSHPDVTWVMPELEQVERGWAGRSDFGHAPSRDIRIEQVRALQERLAYRALEAPHKVALIITAHAMNPPAQNALLKTLEEPPRDTILVLVSSAPDKLLPTIRSRCARAHFGPLSEELIARMLVAQKKLSAEDAARVATMAGGSLARALELDVETLAERSALIQDFEALAANDARGWLALAEGWGADRVTAEGALEVLEVWLRDVACAQAGAGRLVHSELSELAQTSAAKVSPVGLARRAQLVAEAKNAISARNGAARLQLERMFIEMHAG